MDKENSITLSKYRLEQSKENLEEALLLFEQGKYKGASNRAYYSIFHAMKAICALDEVDFKKHSGVISYFNKEYVSTNIFSREIGKRIGEARFYREQSDYVDFYIITKEECQEQIKTAEIFLKETEIYLKAKYGELN
ncbi:MAG: HEPN domain-containing protein [Clostridia bacterium]|nr:HEPN domain-containing protein [Clostridia bacterium]